VERWAEDECTKLGPVTVLKYRRALMALARLLGERSLAEATPGDVEAWLAPLAPRTRANSATPLRSFYRWAAAERIVAPQDDPNRVVCLAAWVEVAPETNSAPSGRTPEPDGPVSWDDDTDMDPGMVPRRSKEMRTGAAVTAYLRQKRDAGTIAHRTEHATRSVLDAFIEHCPQDASRIRRPDVLRWMRTTSHLAAGTRRLYTSKVRGFTNWLLRRGVLRKDPFLDVPAPKVPRAVHRALAAEQALALFAACETPRETVAVVLGLHTGLRRAEMTALEVGDIDLRGRTVFVRCGKGGHQRLLPLSTEAVVVVGRYIASQGLSDGPLLRSLNFPQRGIAPATLGDMFRGLAERAGVKVRARDGVGTHSLRHTAATNWYEDTGDVLAVRDLLGHESLATTQRYVRGMNVERLRAAVEATSYLEPEARDVAP